MKTSIMRQQLLRQGKQAAEVRALLERHLDVRTITSAGPSLAAQLVLALESLALTIFLSCAFQPFVVVVNPHSWLIHLALSLSLRLIGSSLLLILALAALVVYLLLPIARPFFSYFTPLGILASAGIFVASLNLFSALLLWFGYPLNLQTLYLFGFAGLGVGMPLFFLLIWLTQRKQPRVELAQARVDLVQTHLALEQILLTREHVLKRPEQKKQTALEKAPQADIPRFYLARHPDGTYTVAFSADLPMPLMKQLADVTPKTAFTDQVAVGHLLAEDAPCEDIWTGKLYTFPESITPLDFPDATATVVPWSQGQEEDEDTDVDQWDTPLAMVTVDEQIMATCRAQKINQVAAEAWVQPEPSNRNAVRQVTLAWAYTMQRNGKIPFFSHYTDDEAAADLARGLGLTLVADEVAYY